MKTAHCMVIGYEGYNITRGKNKGGIIDKITYICNN